MKLYMKTTTDEYELPIAVEDSPTALAKKLGIDRNSISSMCSKGVCGYYKIEVEPEMYPDNDGGLWYRDPDTWETVYLEG